ncbi:PAP2 superfamily protein [Asanoa ferruginea]|uniref:PAP2 superfamily protein n=1 Tax=Asanoa ferruginea TaxID=53367 RepID=A0A3D9ZQX6_9ACTN|nr:vanadium-dependent haloperoxidase [Asanoa ferruginea]REF99567.1 PAP2 superfamily protein [Asanoa ferruginea]GIF52273.1 haloperoxidase [Asanoa ferruginea]
MNRRELLVAVGGAAALVATRPAPAAGHSRTARPPNAALHWSGIAEAAIAPGRPPGSAGVLGGIVHGAIHDAGAAASGRYPALLVAPCARGRADADAAVATAAYLVLSARVPAQADSLADSYAAYRALLDNSPAVGRGLDRGRQVAEAVLALRADDGFDATVPWTQPAPGPGVFEPVLTNPDGTPATPVDVKLGRVTPLVIAAADQFRPLGPYQLTSAAYAADLVEVAAYGRVDSTVRSPAQTDTARFWAENTFTQWSRTLRGLGAERRLDTAAAARMLGLAQVTAADALIACFNAKYHYLFWRPVHAIARADSDGNPATTADPTWRSLLTVNHPEYVSAHATWSNAITTALAGYFHTSRIPLTMTSTITGTTRTYRTLPDAAADVTGARIWAGLHFRKSLIDGARLGRRVAGAVAAHARHPRQERL